jgi:predicted nucleotidyltransferase
MSSVLRELADEVGVSERTLRRGVGSRLIRARYLGSRKLLLSPPEVRWVRSHWQLVAELRAALRTEPNVELVVLFGSIARGEDIAGVSDVDLLVALRRQAPGALEALRLRLSRRLAREVQIAPLDAAQRNPRLLAEVLRDGRPLVDRGGAWRRLQGQRQQARAQAGRLVQRSREEAEIALDYFQRLADARARSPVDGSHR